MKFNLKDKNEYIRIIKFGLVGVANTAVDWIVFFILNTLFSLPAALCQPFSYACGVVTSYLGNKFFTFKSKNKITVAETVKFIVVNLLSLGASTLVIYLFTNMLLWNGYIAKIPATIIAMSVNFIGSRFFVFAQSVESDNKKNNE